MGYYCSECGSKDVEYKCWVSAISELITDSVDDEDGWCNDCEEGSGQIVRLKYEK